MKRADDFARCRVEAPKWLAAPEGRTGSRPGRSSHIHTPKVCVLIHNVPHLPAGQRRFMSKDRGTQGTAFCFLNVELEVWTARSS